MTHICDICYKEKDDSDIAWDEVQACFACVKLIRNRKECQHLDNIPSRMNTIGWKFCPFCGAELK